MQNVINITFNDLSSLVHPEDMNCSFSIHPDIVCPTFVREYKPTLPEIKFSVSAWHNLGCLSIDCYSPWCDDQSEGESWESYSPSSIETFQCVLED